MRRKKEKRRKAREREKERKEKIFFYWEKRGNLIIFFFLASRYNAQPFKLKKYSYSTVVAACILSISGAKNSNKAI